MTQEELDKLALTIGTSIALCHKEVLTLDEAARYMGVAKSYLYKLTSARQIPHYKPNGKNCFFRRAELEDWLTENRVATNADLDDKAQAYCLRNNATNR